MIKQFFNGVCMALADSVPGVSGGTIAFIMGFYDKFISSINNLVYEKGDKRKEAIIYLAKLGIGWAFGMVCAVLVLSKAFETHIYAVSSLFMGFIIASFPIMIKEEKKSFMEDNIKNIVFLFIGALIVIGITAANQINLFSVSSLDNFNIPLLAYLFISGMVAISAMFLPGISGSTILLILGLYMPIISAIKNFLHLKLMYFPALFVFGIGVIAGALSVVKLIKICLDRHRSKTMYVILGMMVGSLYAIVKGPTTLETPVSQLTFSNFNYITFIIGGALVIGLQILGSIKVNTEKSKNK